MYLVIDGGAFVIIVRVIKRKFEKQKCASLYQKFKIVLVKEFLLLIATSELKKIHTLVSILQKE